MLIDHITNPLFRLRVLSSQGEERSLLAKQAFLFIVRTRNAYDYQKENVLDEIAQGCPGLTEMISDEEMLVHFQHFCQEATRRGEITSTAELDWVSRYIRDPAIRMQIEKMIYRIFLIATSHWDRARWDYCWMISDSEQHQMVREVLLDKGLGSKRKLELAQEFDEPHEEFLRSYYQKLLYDRHYDKAESLGVSYPDLVYVVVVANMNAGYFRDALEVAQRFLPDRTDLTEEIQQMIAAING